MSGLISGLLVFIGFASTAIAGPALFDGKWIRAGSFTAIAVLSALLL